jgi:hypothetical protein
MRPDLAVRYLVHGRSAIHGPKMDGNNGAEL